MNARICQEVELVGALLSANIRLEEDVVASGSVEIPSGSWIFAIIAQVETPFDDDDTQFDLGDTDTPTLWADGVVILGNIGSHPGDSVPGDHTVVVDASEPNPALGWKHYPSGTTITGILEAVAPGAGVLVITVIYTVPSAKA